MMVEQQDYSVLKCCTSNILLDKFSYIVYLIYRQDSNTSFEMDNSMSR